MIVSGLFMGTKFPYADFTPHFKKCKLGSMELEIVRADPAGNITILVLSPVTGRENRAEAVAALLADPDLRAEQAGFVVPPAAGGRWRLEMMGGEFCGNAARSFGLLRARQSGRPGAHTQLIEISGMGRPLPVHVDTAAGTAEAEMPAPLAETVLVCGGRRFPAYIFEGITHVIALDMEPGVELLSPLLGAIEQCRLPDAWHHPDALGIMFYDTRKCFMRPLVWVRSSGTTVFESSCGSGSSALGRWLARDAGDGEVSFEPVQPGGSIRVRLVKERGAVRQVFIGGPVGLSAPLRWTPRPGKAPALDG
jgi:diaminopimelate epimerase